MFTNKRENLIFCINAIIVSYIGYILIMNMIKKECRCRFLVNKRVLFFFDKQILVVQVIKPPITSSILHSCLTEIHLLHLFLETLMNKAITSEGECAFKV